MKKIQRILLLWEEHIMGIPRKEILEPLIPYFWLLKMSALNFKARVFRVLLYSKQFQSFTYPKRIHCKYCCNVVKLHKRTTPLLKCVKYQFLTSRLCTPSNGFEEQKASTMSNPKKKHPSFWRRKWSLGDFHIHLSRRLNILAMSEHSHFLKVNCCWKR